MSCCPRLTPGTCLGEGAGSAAGEREGVGELTVRRLETNGRAHHGIRVASWDLAAEVRTAARARVLTRETLLGWGVTDPADTDEVVLIVDELVTNAVVHGHGQVRLELRLDGSQLVGEVGDDGAGVPRARESEADSENGRGLWLVAALAAEFGVRPESAGKTLWFTRPLALGHGSGQAASAGGGAAC
jgi:anti-sigma regulatory factor (Ser/Thr protein kinase)